MNNIPINRAETIFEPFWDSGESYPNHQKYSRLEKYRILYGENALAKVSVGWNGIKVSIEKAGEGPTTVAMERDCRLFVEKYDRLLFFGAIPSAFQFRLFVEIDGEFKCIIHEKGNNSTKEYIGNIAGREITKVRLDFYNEMPQPYEATLYWIGLANSKKQDEMEEEKSPYDSKWEGCFQKDGRVEPMIGLYFGKNGLDKLREKVKKDPFRTVMEKIRRQAREDLKLKPEADISKYVANPDRRWVRDRDAGRAKLTEPMERLAFVGLVDENRDMLRMACRIALSVAHCRYWCESIMGVFPGATWHHRSFTEEAYCRACALVLDWAGNQLTWHGKNILWDAIIMKGLPRIEADFKTMEYIREMNQGIVFSAGRILALLALTSRYPRYQGQLLEAEKDLHEMLDAYLLEDGGTKEGPSYWNYTFWNSIPALYALARYHGMELKDYIGDKIRKTGEFALAMLSDSEDGTRILPVNDSKMISYHPLVAAFFSAIQKDSRWTKLYTKSLKQLDESLDHHFLIAAHEAIEESGPLYRGDSFLSFEKAGQVSLRRSTPDLGMIHLHLVSGPMYFGHSHGDKGSFILEVGGNPILIDRGIGDYNNPVFGNIGKSYNHNVLQPEAEDSAAYEQPVTKHAQGVIVQAKFQNGALQYCSDLTDVWQEGIFRKNIRSITSETPYCYMIHDHVEYVRPMRSSFRLNTLGRIEERDGYFIIVDGKVQIAIYPINYTPDSVFYGEDGYNFQMRTVNQLRLYTAKGSAHDLYTGIEISRPGQETGMGNFNI